MWTKELPTQRTRDRFIELGDQFRRVYVELRDYTTWILVRLCDSKSQVKTRTAKQGQDSK